MDQPRKELAALLRPRLKDPGFNEGAFLRRFDEVLDAGGMRRDSEAPPAPPPLVQKPQGTPISKWQAMIDLPLLRIAFPTNSAAVLAEWVEPTRTACVRWGIDLPREIASFLGNISVESQDLKLMTESLNYSVDALIAKFGRHRISIADARRYGRAPGQTANQEALANILYGGEWGRANLGNTEPGDGWRCKGFGPKQLTGRSNQQRFADAVAMTLEEAQRYMRTPEGGMMAAGWFWLDKNMDAKAATPGIEDDRRAVNGGTFGLTEVGIAFDRILHELLRRERIAA
jgi:putative chitinase